MAYGKSRSLCGLYAATAGSSLSQQDNANRRRGSGGKAPVGFGRIAGVAMRTVQTGLFPRGEKRRLALIAVWKRGGKGIAEIIRRAEGRAERKTASVQTTGGSPAYPSQRRGALTDTEAAYKDAHKKGRGASGRLKEFRKRRRRRAGLFRKIPMRKPYFRARGNPGKERRML